jgi:hypothetical protein
MLRVMRGFYFIDNVQKRTQLQTYQECREAGMFLAWRQFEVWWYCSSLHAAGKLSGEKQQQVAELKRSGRR